MGFLSFWQSCRSLQKAVHISCGCASQNLKTDNVMSKSYHVTISNRLNFKHLAALRNLVHGLVKSLKQSEDYTNIMKWPVV